MRGSISVPLQCQVMEVLLQEWAALRALGKAADKENHLLP